ncbi:MAG: HNH endonuclease [Bacteroidetes bacterium]|nr:HNH endonuclease [Bacteroidota bacterium]
MKIWTEEQLFILAALYPFLPMNDLIEIIPHGSLAIAYAARRYKLCKTGRLWSWRYEDEQRFIELYPHNSNAELAEMFGKSEATINAAAFKLNLYKTPEFHYERSSKGFFKPGQEPPNKGKPMPKDVYERCKATMFKKGNVPYNTNYNGHERISKDGYTEIRIRKGKYVLKHRLVWEQHKGKIPRGYIVVFKDRNPKNITIENLEMITLKENMRRNSIHNYPAEIKQVIRLNKKLKRAINEKQNSGPERSSVRTA